MKFLMKVKFLVKVKRRFKFMFGYLFFIRFDMDFLRKGFFEMEEEFEIYIEYFNLVIFFWGLVFLGSDSIFRVFLVGLEYGLVLL